MKRLWERWALIGIVLIYLVTGSVYSVATPAFEAPDESYHFFVVKHILDHRSLPVQRAETRGYWEQEGSQPPLYYALSALLISWIDLSDAEEMLWPNPQANIGDPKNPGNKNRYVHPVGQRFPWSGTVLAVHLLRWFSLLLGASTLLLIWSATRLVFPRQQALALCVAATTAAIPQYLFITSSVSNDSAITCLSALSLLLLARRLRAGTAVRSGQVPAGATGSDRSDIRVSADWAAGGALRKQRCEVRSWGTLGIVLGLALLSKLSALALLPLTGVVIGLAAWHRRSWKSLWTSVLAVGLPVLVLAGWWYARNVVLYGDLTGLDAMVQAVGSRDDFGNDLWGEFRSLRYSFWGLFGWFSIPMSDWVYRALDVLAVLAALGVVVEVNRWARLGLARGAWISLRYREPELGSAYPPLMLSLFTLYLGIISASLVRWTSLTHAAQGRLLFPAIGPLSLLFVAGLRTWFPAAGRTRDVASGILILALYGLATFSPWQWIRPAYALPRRVSALPAGAIPANVPFGDAIVLQGVGLRQETVFPGEAFRIDLYWQASRSLAAEPSLMVWLRLIKEQPAPHDVAGGVVGLEDAYPGSGTFPTSLWPVDQLLVGTQYIHVGQDAPAPIIARLDVTLYREDTGKRLETPGPDLPTIGRVKVIPRRWPTVSRRDLVAEFDPGVSLAAYDLPEVVRAGQASSIRLTWVVQVPPERDYTVFVHLEDADGQVWGYGDGAPRAGNYPTRAWDKGEVIEDEHLLAVSGETPPGRYRVVVGLYGPNGRLAARDKQGDRLYDDAVDLGVVEIR